MWQFIILQLIFSNILLRYLPLNTSLDIYRSCNCFFLSSRGIYYIITKNGGIYFTENTCYLYISYTTLDLYYLFRCKSKRFELIFHHIFTVIAYIQLYFTRNFSHEALLAHIFLLAELLSIFNWLLRGTNILRYWRLLIIISIRLPLWIYMVMTTHLLQHTVSQVLSQFAGWFMPLLDIYFIYKLY